MADESSKGDRPFALLSYVARSFLQISAQDWKALSEEKRRVHVEAANRALNAAKNFQSNPATAND